jgi:uncharacterized protein
LSDRKYYKPPVNEAIELTEGQPLVKPKRKLGFAAMDPEKRRAIARLGGAAVQPHQRAFSRDPYLAAEAGRKGGAVGHGGGRPKKVPSDD